MLANLAFQCCSGCRADSISRASTYHSFLLYCRVELRWKRQGKRKREDGNEDFATALGGSAHTARRVALPHGMQFFSCPNLEVTVKHLGLSPSNQTQVGRMGKGKLKFISHDSCHMTKDGPCETFKTKGQVRAQLRRCLRAKVTGAASTVAMAFQVSIVLLGCEAMLSCRRWYYVER